MMLCAFFYAQFVVRKAPGASRSRSSIARHSPAQKDAEQLLQRAAANDSAAIAQIDSRAATWRGQIALTPQLSRLIAAGLNANDLRVRAATIQLDLAAMNVAEDAASVDRLAAQADSSEHATRIWAIWTLGLVANRGLQRERITYLLMAHLTDSDLDSRHWAVEALSYVGTDATIPPLLKAMHDDPAPTVRERAACALAESGMLTNQQRRTAIPTLLAYAEDPSLDAQTHAWTYHALRDITAQHLPDDAAAWRKWYSNSR
jgi:HEAT repeat protein